jgi:hypothetical protein
VWVFRKGRGEITCLIWVKGPIVGTDFTLVMLRGWVYSSYTCRALDLSMNDKELRGRMATEAIKVRERFSIDSIASQWDEVLKLV